MRYLALGDSYTIGERVDPAERWPVQLVALLRQEKIEIEDPIIIAQTGWTTDELMAAIDQQRPSSGYDLVSILIGVNNQFRGYDSEAYRSEFRGLLDRSIEFAGNRPARVIVLSIPDWGVTPFASGHDRSKIAAEIDRFNAINRAETIRSGAHYIDITPNSRRASIEPNLIATDGLHPSGEMYIEWARSALPITYKLLNEGV
jgi:lysophospholipase L1-like esterase